MAEKKKTIVLVEDERTISNLIELKLERSGYKVETAHDGKVGLDLILELKPDLVLLDIALPTLGGFDILNKLKEKKLLPRLPIIIISNSGQPIEIDRAKDAGVRDYLIKVNFSPEEVLEKVRLIFEEEKKENKGKVSSTTDRILLIEDDALLAGSLERKFTQKGYQLFKANNAREAKKVLKENRIDLILLDIILPDIDGFQFLQKLKKDESIKDIPVIIISNLGQKEEIEKGTQAGAADYIVKSDTVPGDILKKVEILLQKK